MAEKIVEENSKRGFKSILWRMEDNWEIFEKILDDKEIGLVLKKCILKKVLGRINTDN